MCIPSLRPISMRPVSCSQRRSRMQLRTAVFPVRISVARTRPVPSSFGKRRWEMTAESELASCAMTCGCCAAGKVSTMRSIAFGASIVWSVPITRWPVSAAVMAELMVSWSRISPTSMTSGSCRRACLRASAKDFVSLPTSRCFTSEVAFWKTYSMGSSTAIMMPLRCWLMC